MSSEEAAIYHAQMRQAEDERDDLRSQLTAAQEEVKRYKEALEAIRGPTDSGPLIDVYRRAGGGYEGLQAIARKGLGEWELVNG